jgi:hypothetical protein
MTADPILRAFRILHGRISEAVDQAKLAYQLSPNSYTFGSLSACLAAQDALAVLRGHLQELTDRIESAA